jgi:alpha-tubulin suppressor-like RCC1 family protein
MLRSFDLRLPFIEIILFTRNRPFTAMNPLRFVVTLLIALILPAAAAEVAATFTSAATVPVTAASYTAAGNTVNLALAFAPPTGTNLTVVNHTGVAFIQGAFDNLAQGQVVNLAYNGITYPFAANYFGGTGNDLVLHWVNTRLLAWGENTEGQLGNNSVTKSLVPVPVDMSGVLAGKTIIAMACGGYHSFALCADGALAAWGSGGYGTLGNNSTALSKVPVLVDRTGVLAGKTVVAVAAGETHSLALCSDGTMATWGYNYFGQLGNGGSAQSQVPVRVTTTGVLSGKTVVAIAAGWHHNLALCADGTLVAWGENSTGQLGNNSTTQSNVPVLVNRAGVLASKIVTAIAAGTGHNMVQCADGTAATWGTNTVGQLGNNSTTQSLVPVLVNTAGVLSGKTIAAIAGGGAHCLAWCTDGTLAAWGQNFYGQLGNSLTTDSRIPVAVTRTGLLAGKIVTKITASGSHSIASCSDGTLAAWGGGGRLGNGSQFNTSTAVAVSTSELRAGERFLTATSSSSANHSIGLVASPLPPAGTTLAATGITDIGATLNASVNAFGSSAAVSFEYGPTTDYGTVVAATPSTVTAVTPTAVRATLVGLRVGTIYHFRVIVAAGGGTVRGADMTFTTTTLATLSALTLSEGELAPAFSNKITGYAASVVNTTGSVTVTPTAAFETSTLTVNGVAVASGAASKPLSLALGNNLITIVVTSAGGTVLTYTVTVTRLPAVFTFNSAASVTVTVADFIATGKTADIKLNFAPTTGTMLTVVRNTGGNPIQGAFANLAQGQLVQLTYGSGTYSFMANYFGGSGNDLVLRWANSRLVTCGYNASGQLGNNSTTTVRVPAPVVATGVLAGKVINTASAGQDHSLALCADGTLAAWGGNVRGQLGNNSTTNSSVPVPVDQTGVLAGKTVVAISAGGLHNLVLCADGAVAAWGYNNYGQLGNNSTTQSAVPVLVDRTGVLAGRTIVAITAGMSHSLALCADGAVAAWGYNFAGQLGNNNTSNQLTPVLVNQSGALLGKRVVAISAGDSHNLALCADGTLVAWGLNYYGHLGNKSLLASSVPVLVDRTGVLAGKTITAISAGSNHSLALCSDNILTGWGYNGTSQLTLSGGFMTSLEPVGLYQIGALTGKTITGIAASGGSSHTLCTDTTLASWGYNYYGKLGNNGSSDIRDPVATLTTSLRSGETFMALAPGVVAGHLMVVTALPMPSLSGLTLSAGGLSPTFSATTTSYTASVGNAITALTVTPATTDALATIKVNGTTVASGTASGAINLAVGANVVTVSVATPDGAARNYTITITVNNHAPSFAGYAVTTPYQTAVPIALTKLVAKAADADGDALAVTAAGPAANAGGVALGATAVTYTPPAGFSGTDTFPVTIRDARGATVTGTVTVTVGPAPSTGGAGVNPPVLTSLPDGRMGLAFHGIPGRSYRVQRSADGLGDWVTLAAIIADPSGKVSFTDDSPPAGSAFYRLGLP